MKNLVFIAVLTGLFVGCATQPKKIQTQYVSPLIYKDHDCDQLAFEQYRIERRTTELYTSLKNEANADSWQMGIGLVLFWPALFFLEGGDGPEAAEYSRLKGEYEALSDVSVMKKCAIDFQDDLSDLVKDADSTTGTVGESEEAGPKRESIPSESDDINKSVDIDT